MAKRQSHKSAGGAAQRLQAPRERSVVSWWRVAAVCLVALACYVQAAGYDFVYDDSVQIVTNPRIRSFSNLGAAFTENFWAFNAADAQSNYYRPLQTVTYMVAYALGGLSPFPYHALSILLHVLASLAVSWFAWELLGAGRDTRIRGVTAMWAGMLFAAHPMHTESVTWIAGVTDVGCGLFYFLSLSCHLRWRRGEAGGGRRWWYGAALACFLTALLYKEMALTLPAAIVLVDLAEMDRVTTAAVTGRLRAWSGYAAVLVGYLALRIHVLGAISRTVIPLPVGLPDCVLTMLYFVGRYLRDLLLPYPQSAFHVFRPFSRLAPDEWLLPSILLVLQLWLIWTLWRRRERRLAFLAALVLFTLVPVLYLGGVGANMYTEHYLYIPSLGFCILLAIAAPRLLKGRRAAVATGCVVAVWALLAVARNPVWRDNRSFYTATAAASPDAGLIWNNLAKIHFGDRDVARARREFETALQVDAASFMSSPVDRATSRLGLAAVANAEGRTDDAWHYAEEVSRAGSSLHRSDAYQLMGMLLGKRGDYAQAERYLRSALELRPTNDAARVNLGNVLLLRGDMVRAEREFRAAVELNPRSAGAYVSLALLLNETRRKPEAAALLRQALALDPGNPQARQLLQRLTP